MPGAIRAAAREGASAALTAHTEARIRRSTRNVRADEGPLSNPTTPQQGRQYDERVSALTCSARLAQAAAASFLALAALAPTTASAQEVTPLPALSSTSLTEVIDSYAGASMFININAGYRVIHPTSPAEEQLIRCMDSVPSSSRDRWSTAGMMSSYAAGWWCILSNPQLSLALDRHIARPMN